MSTRRLIERPQGPTVAIESESDRRMPDVNSKLPNFDLTCSAVIEREDMAQGVETK